MLVELESPRQELSSNCCHFLENDSILARSERLGRFDSVGLSRIHSDRRDAESAVCRTPPSSAWTVTALLARLRGNRRATSEVELAFTITGSNFPVVVLSA